MGSPSKEDIEESSSTSEKRGIGSGVLTTFKGSYEDTPESMRGMKLAIQLVIGVESKGNDKGEGARASTGCPSSTSKNEDLTSISEEPLETSIRSAALDMDNRFIKKSKNKKEEKRVSLESEGQETPQT
ncbi:hypothetical protein U1Q18_043028 [Sarracenia purpurea var. burkii]